MLTKDNLSYLGVVATPSGVFHYAGAPATVDFARREYVNAIGHQVGRLSMVAPKRPESRVGGDDRNNPVVLFDRSVAAIAPLVGGLTTPITTWFSSADGGVGFPESLIGLQVVGNTALGSGSVYYDANGSQQVSWFATDWPLTSTSTVTPWKAVNSGRSQGWAAGPMTIIPERFRAALGGDVLFGQPGSLPIISRQSFGPCAIVGTASDFIGKAPVPAKVLLGYGNGDLHLWSVGANDEWNSATQYAAMVFVGDYLLYIGVHGYGEACYGEGTNDLKLKGTPDDVGNPLCYDPTGPSKGCHAFPYRNQALIYQVSDLAASAAGTLDPKAVKPVGWFPLDFPHFDHPHYGAMPVGGAPGISGAAYDSERCELHVCATGQDSDGYEPGPLWHVFKVNGVPSVANPVISLDGSIVPTPVPVPVPEPIPAPPGGSDPADKAKIEALSLQLTAALAANEALISANNDKAKKLTVMAEQVVLLTDKLSDVLDLLTTHTKLSNMQAGVLAIKAKLPKTSAKWLIDAVNALLA